MIMNIITEISTYDRLFIFAAVIYGFVITTRKNRNS